MKMMIIPVTIDLMMRMRLRVRTKTDYNTMMRMTMSYNTMTRRRMGSSTMERLRAGWSYNVTMLRRKIGWNVRKPPVAQRTPRMPCGVTWHVR